MNDTVLMPLFVALLIVAVAYIAVGFGASFNVGLLIIVFIAAVGYVGERYSK